MSVYNFSTDEYTVIDCDAAPDLVATDGEIVAYAADTQVYTCNVGAGETAFTSAQLSGSAKIAGLAVLYGKTYYVKGNGTRGVVGGTSVEMSSANPTGLAADLYGTLYVSYQSGNAQAFSEEAFLSDAAGEETGINVPGNATSLRADFEGNLYYLSDGNLYQNGQPIASVDGSDFVYGADSTQNALSFALGFEDDAVYFNFGNYVVKSNAGTMSAIPTLDEIAENGAREKTFSLHTENMLVKVAARSVGIDTDLAAFRASDGSFFPYCGYARSEQEQTGLLLTKTDGEDGYALVLFANADGSYTARLYPSQAVTPEEAAAREEQSTRWLSNEVGTFFVPCTQSALEQTRLARGTRVAVLRRFTAPDAEYALVAYTDGTREEARGWVPAAYLSAVSPFPAAGEEYTVGYLKAQEDGILFTAADGSQKTVTERVQVRLYQTGDGTFRAVLTDDTAYIADITEDMLDKDNAEILRIALIVILSVLALIIVGVYIFLLPWEKYRKDKKK